MLYQQVYYTKSNFSFVKSLPVIFISLIVCWSYYAYFVATLLTLVTDSAEQIVCGLIFHVVTALFVWSYYMIVFTPAGQAPDSWYCKAAFFSFIYFIVLFQAAEPAGCGHPGRRQVRGGVEAAAERGDAQPRLRGEAAQRPERRQILREVSLHQAGPLAPLLSL